MKKQVLITLAIFAIAYYIGVNSAYSISCIQQIGPPKSINVSSTRYFFVGYSLGGKAEGNIQWFSNDGAMPRKTEVYKFLKKTYPELQFEYNKFVMVGVYEFKNKKECDQFFEFQNQQP